jgi:hypothetical protein
MKHGFCQSFRARCERLERQYAEDEGQQLSQMERERRFWHAITSPFDDDRLPEKVLDASQRLQLRFQKFSILPRSVADFSSMPCPSDPRCLQVEYGADLQTLDIGSGFPTRVGWHANAKHNQGSKSQAAHPWNINNWPIHRRSLFRFIDQPVSGVKVGKHMQALHKRDALWFKG